jgi:hypothetical protein
LLTYYSVPALFPRISNTGSFDYSKAMGYARANLITSTIWQRTSKRGLRTSDGSRRMSGTSEHGLETERAQIRSSSLILPFALCCVE